MGWLEKFFPAIGVAKYGIIAILILLIAILGYVEIDKIVNEFDTLFGIPTKQSLEKKVNQDTNIITSQQTANVQLATTVKTDVKAEAIVNQVTNQNKVSVNTAIAKAETIDTTRQEDIVQTETVTDKTQTQTVVDEDVSKIQIDSIWSTYCSFNTDSQCPKPVTN